MGGGGSGSSGPTTQTVQQNTIAPEASPYYSTVLGQASALTDINQHPYQQYQGERVAGLDPMQTQAFTELQGMQLPGQTQAASDTAAGIASQAQGYQGYQTGRFGTANANNAALMQSYMNPYIQTALDPTLQLMQQNAAIGQRTLGQQAQQAGAFGGYRQGVQQGVQAGQDALAQGNVIGNMYQQGYGMASQNFQADMARKLQAQQAREQSRQFGGTLGLQGLNTSLQAAGLQGQLGQQQYAQQMGLNQARQLAGAQQQALQQQKLDTQYQDFLSQQNWPYKNLAFMSDIIGRPLQNTSTSIYQAPPTPGQSLLGLGMGAYGLSQLVKAKGGIVKLADGGFVQKDFLTPKEDKENKGLIDPATLTGIAAIDQNAFTYDPALQQYAKLGVPPPTQAPAQPVRYTDPSAGMGGEGDGIGTDASDAAAANAAAAEGAADAAGTTGADAGGVGAAPYRRGGNVHRYANGGNVMSTLDTLGKLPPNYLSKMQKYQPLTGMVQKGNRQLETAAPLPAQAQLTPTDQGVAQLPTGPMSFKDGGIVGYQDGGDVVPTSRATPYDPDAITGMLTPWSTVEERVRAGDPKAIAYTRKRLAAGPGIIGVVPPESIVDYMGTLEDPSSKEAVAAESRRMAGYASALPAFPLTSTKPDIDKEFIAKLLAGETKKEKKGTGTGTGTARAATSGIENLVAPKLPEKMSTQERINAHKAYMEGVRDPETEALIEKLGSGIEQVASEQQKALNRAAGAAWLGAGAAALKPGQGFWGGVASAGESLATSMPKVEAERAKAAEWRQKAQQAQTMSELEYRKGNLASARALAKDAEQADEKAKELEVRLYGAKVLERGHYIDAASREKVAQIMANAKASGNDQDYRHFQRIAAIKEAIPRQATAAALAEFKVPSLEMLDDAQRAAFARRRTQIEQDLLRQNAPLIRGINEKLSTPLEAAELNLVLGLDSGAASSGLVSLPAGAAVRR